MRNKIKFQDLGLIDYQEAWDYQEKLFSEVAAKKVENQKNNTDTQTNHLLFCEHPHVYTLGKSGTVNNLLINDEFLAKIGATYYKTNRGGDITYHGQGQIVGYPIIDLDNFNLQLKQYINLLEESIIRTIKIYGIEGHRLEGATGVWLDVNDKTKTRKICAMGVRASHWVTMHGFALNVNTDLSYFNHINPCGFVDKGITSLEKELGRKIDFKEVQMHLKNTIAEVFNIEIV